MKILKITVQIFILYGFYIAGEILHMFLNIPLPGSIIGLLLLFALLSLNILPPRWIQDGAGFLIAILPLLLIPVTVGVIEFPSLLSTEGFLAVLMVAVSTLLTMFAAGKSSEWLEGKMKKRERGEE